MKTLFIFILFGISHFANSQKTIYVTESNDKRFIAYKDSLDDYYYQVFFLNLAKSINDRTNASQGELALKKERQYCLKHHITKHFHVIKATDLLFREFTFVANVYHYVPTVPINPKIKVIYKKPTRYRFITKINIDINGDTTKSVSRTIIANKTK